MTQPAGGYWVEAAYIYGQRTVAQHRADGSIVYWRRKPNFEWVKLPHWWHPATFAYQPWRPRPKHSCDVAQ